MHDRPAAARKAACSLARGVLCIDGIASVCLLRACMCLYWSVLLRCPTRASVDTPA